MGMKAKTIKQILRRKVDQWLETIEDSAVKQLAAENTIVTGGCLASMLLGEEVNDFDIYFRNHETTLKVAQYYVSRFSPENRKGIDFDIFVKDSEERVKVVIKSAGIASEEGTEKPYEYFETQGAGEAAGYVGEIMQDPGDIQDRFEETEKLALETEDDGKPKYRPVFMSTNAITLSHKIQIILRFFGEPDEIHKNYDFVHCTNYWQSWDNHLELRKEALEALLARELRYVGSKYPICSLIRMRKFIRRNWKINAGQVLKMCWQASELDLSKIDVLEDQLTGVDVAYFMELVSKLKEKDPDKVNSAYLVEVLDRMF